MGIGCEKKRRALVQCIEAELSELADTKMDALYVALKLISFEDIDLFNKHLWGKYIRNEFSSAQYTKLLVTHVVLGEILKRQAPYNPLDLAVQSTQTPPDYPDYVEASDFLGVS